MAEIRTIPTIATQEIASGGTCAGDLPDGTDSEETLHRGRYRLWSGCTKAGRLEIAPELQCGFSVTRVSVTSTGPTAFDVYLVDPDGFDFHVGTLAAGSGFVDFGHNPLVVPPGFAMEARLSGGAISADSRLMFVLGKDWGEKTFDYSPSLGRANIPPSMARP